ncbi:DUF732 domain-containing protein [Mycobacterium hodleri]|nr:DUF732 domain-containing protein [Mycolicibacterium hodleri]
MQAVSAAMAAVFLAAPAPAHADVDTDFANQLHVYGIYGPRDENAWLAKLTCKRLTSRVDGDAFASARFLKTNLARTTSTQQVWQFLGAAVDVYCPEQTPALQSAADTSAAATKNEEQG